MPEPVQTKTPDPNVPATDERDRERRRPSLRNRTIYERRVLGGETLAALATEYNVTHQRIAQIATRVEGWIAGHPEDQLANRLRLRCRLRYESLYESAVTGFADSRKEEVTVKQRTTTRAAPRRSPNVVLRSAEERASAERKATVERALPERKATMPDEDQEDPNSEIVISVEERIVRQRHGDPRLLATAMKAVEKLERFAAALARENEGFGSREAAARNVAPRQRPHAEPVQRDPISTFAIRPAASPEVGGQDSGISEEKLQQPADVIATASSLATLHTPLATSSLPTTLATLHTPLATSSLPATLATLHTPLPPQPLPTAGCLLPTSPTTCLKPKHVLIVGHYKQIDRMFSLAQAKLPGFEITAACQAWVAKEWIEKHVHEAALVWLENDLGPWREEPGGTINPGTGREVAVRLACARPRCRVLINEGDDHSRPLYKLLDAAGCSVKEVFHEGADWLRDNWLPALRRALRLRDEESDFYFEDEDDDDYEDEDDF